MEKKSWSRWWLLPIYLLAALAVFVFGWYDGVYWEHVQSQATYSNSATMPNSEEKMVDVKHIPEGMYAVGSDIPAGTYRLIDNSNTTAYMAVYSNATTSLDSLVVNDNFRNQRYVSVKNGEYIQIVRCYMQKEN